MLLRKGCSILQKVNVQKARTDSADTKSAFRQRFVQVGILLNIKSLDIRGNECGSAKWSPCIAQGPQATHLLLIGYEARRMGRGVGSREMTGHMFPGLPSQ